MTRSLRPLSIRTRLTLWYSAVLLTILIVVGALSYSVLRWTLVHDLDASLLTVARFIRDSDYEIADSETVGHSNPEAALQDVLGPEFYDKVFQLVDATGAPEIRSTQLRHRTLPLSAEARANARRGFQTFETVRLSTGEPVRLLTMPTRRPSSRLQFLQVAIPYRRVQQELGRYLQILFVLVPIGLGLATVGGATLVRTALARVDEMSTSARRISAEDLGERISVRGAADELDRLAETLNGMLGRLQTAFTEIRRFTADAAHQLRTPLTALTGEIEVALRADRSPEEYRRILRSGLEEVGRLTRLANDLLLLSRSSAGPVLSRERIDLEALVLDVIDVGTRLALPRHVGVQLDGVVSVAVIGDGLALHRAMLNLVENAVNYTTAGGMVHVGLSREEHVACISVRDTGIGIARSDLARIFEPFVRLDAARISDSSGAGLGLAIAHSIVLAHGGTIAVDSAVGVGSCFTIRLPPV